MLDRIIAAKWALDSTYHDRMYAIALRRIQNGQAPFEVSQDRPTPYLVDVERPNIGASAGYNRLARANTKSGQVLVLPMLGAISRYGDLCSYGAEDYASWLMEMNQDDTMSAAVLNLNGPGGEVDGIEMLGEVIKHSKKPIVAYVAGWAASAHYWIASQCREIVMESLTTSSVGSIGVLAMHVDATEFYKNEGLKVTIIRSDGSDNKARFNSVEPLTPELEAEIRGELTVIRGTFISKVLSMRPKITDTADTPNGVFSGKMYNGKEALSNGLADRIGYLGDAIYRADLLARKQAA
ncbi:S49 family peptidase [Spirosoma endophyticum]|uniref:Protease-4 n=1 Tax=Spirosoma endophyticum TaxID=662367 RepID=A0A1I1SM22_9BACT|nr:S49 family peptidase [Spirosoma endophyticum]SFD47352.1 protease-4 [Spirosoma endophyticum]